MNLLHELSNYSIYLISQSPRRQALLREMGIDFTCCHSSVDEVYPPNLSPTEVAEFIANLKFDSIPLQDYPPNSIFIACDTIVVLHEKIIGKPNDAKEAKNMLQQLSNQSHRVISGLVVGNKNKKLIRNAVTEVQFSALSASEIDYYISHYAPFDKAGGYGIQEWIGHVAITSIQGSYYNVMGLPTKLLWDSLLEICQSK